MDCRITDLYDLTQTIAAGLFDGLTYPWEALPRIGDFTVRLGETLDPERFEKRGDDIWVARSAKVAPTAYLSGPLIIDEEAEIRHCAFIRGKAIVGKHCVVGNSTELKNSVLFNHVQVPHYNYVGDSILGYYAHMGAGSITSNVKADRTQVAVKYEAWRIDTGLKKFGAMLGDHVEVGCNAVLNPGTVVGPNTNIYPLSMVRGVIPAGSIYKSKNEITKKIMVQGVQEIPDVSGTDASGKDPAPASGAEGPAAGEGQTAGSVPRGNAAGPDRASVSGSAAASDAASVTEHAAAVSVTPGTVRTIYIVFVREIRKRREDESIGRYVTALFNGGNRKDPLQDQFAKDIEQALQTIAGNAPGSEEVRELLRYMYTAQEDEKNDRQLYLIFLAVHRYTDVLIPFLNRADAGELFSLYEQVLPKRERMPVNDQIYKLLKKQAKQAAV